MQFRIADTFTDSLTRLTGDEQKVVKTTAFDLQIDPANPGMKFHKLDRAKDPNFWSVRAGRDLRIIVHRSDGSLLLCYVDHHDQAHRWAERRKLERHPRTGAAQLVEVRERVEEIRVPTYVPESPPEKPKLFEDLNDDDLLGWGVPRDWIEEVRSADEDSVLDLVEHLPAEAGEALLELAVGGRPARAAPISAETDAFSHPDAQRRFRLVADSDELRQALEFPWEKWSIFLHPDHRSLVEQEFNGPARVAGSAGTGKTVVALHRAAHLARRHSDARVLLTTLTDSLAGMLAVKLRRLAGHQPQILEHTKIQSLDSVADRLYRVHVGKVAIAQPKTVTDWIREFAAAKEDIQLSSSFLISEWQEVIDPWQIETLDDYIELARRGHRTRLAESHRSAIWPVFQKVIGRLRSRDEITRAGLFKRLAVHFSESATKPFDHIVVDEAQDLSIPQLRFLSSLSDDRPNSLFFAGDQGQRTFQAPFSWKSLGVDIRGRSRVLRVNYRTSHQIRQQADRLLGPEVSDLDGNVEERKGTVSVFNGPAPTIKTFDEPAEEIEGVAAWLKHCAASGIEPHEIAVFVRSEEELNRAQMATESGGMAFTVLDELLKIEPDHIALSTMHLAKGLEFRAVAVMACNDEVIPFQARIQTAADEPALLDIYNTERHLMYVACTRAREQLWLSNGGPASEFLDDLNDRSQRRAEN